MLATAIADLTQPEVLAPLRLSLKLAAVTTSCLVIFATPLAYWLAKTPYMPSVRHHQGISRLKLIIIGLIAMPLVLPPTVLGFYLLLLFSPNTALGQWLTANNLQALTQLAFSFKGVVIGSLIYTLPFYIQPVYAQFLRIPNSVHDMARLYEASGWRRFWRVLLPQVRSGIVLGALMSFAHTIGEFGVVLMIGGSIAGETKVMSIAIYEQVEALNYPLAHTMSLLLVGLGVILITLIALVHRLTRR